MRKTRDLVLMALFAALVAVGAFLRVPLPAIPFTLQFLFTALAGILLGSRHGAISVACYVIIGLVGFPVFTAGGGPSYIFHPTFGYLPAFIVGAWVIGRIAEQSPAPSVKRLLAASLIGLALVLVIGAVYYWMICTFYLGTPVGARALTVTCFLAVLPGDLVQCVLAAVLGSRLAPVLRRGEAARA